MLDGHTRFSASCYRTQSFGGAVGIQRGVEGTSQDIPHYCHIIPGHNKYFLQEDIFFLIAPRPLLGVMGELSYSRNVEFSEMIGKAYGALDASSFFRLEIVPGGHEYFVQPAIQFFKSYL